MTSDLYRSLPSGYSIGPVQACSRSEFSYLKLGRKADGGPSGIAEREDIVMLGLVSNSEDVEDNREGDTELRDDRLLGI